MKMKTEFDKQNTAPSLAEIAAQIEENAGKIKELNEKVKKLCFEEKVSRFKTTPEDACMMRELGEIGKEMEKREKIRSVLLHNYRAVLAAQSLPVFVEIMHKYGGRKAGEKTRQKINEEMRAACDCSVWFNRCSDNNSFSAEIYESDGGRRGERFTVYGKSGLELIDEENTIIGKLTAEDLRANAGEYVENPAARVEEIEEAERRVEEAREAYNETVDAYNALIVDGYDSKSRVY